MSFQNPAFRTRRMSVVGMEGMHSKMFDPPAESPVTPESLDPLNPPVLPPGVRFNPVPEVMAAAGFLDKVTIPHTLQRSLLHGASIITFDNLIMDFMLFRDDDGIDNGLDPGAPGAPAFNPAKGAFPAPTIRVPRGAIFRCETQGQGPPPHTIHWHGQEPTPMNDGVGHCSMEIGQYIYQWQPNFIGSYFYHCHRNTVQHFEFGLYGFTIIDPPDAFFASILSTNPDGTVNLNAVPIGNGRPRADEPDFPLGRRRTAANLVDFPQFGQTAAMRVPLDTPDPLGQYPADPHAYTVPYDLESLMVVDDRDIRWSIFAKDAKATFPAQGDIPGVNDNFTTNADFLITVPPDGWFAFNDYRSSHYYVTGINVPGRPTGTAAIAPGLVIPPELMSGVSGVQVSINALRGQNILLRFLNAAYNNVRVRFPVDLVIIAWDGRALGVPPYGAYNKPVLVPANTPMMFSVARRFDALIRVETNQPAVNDVATVEFLDTRGLWRRFTAQIPVVIS